MLQTVINPSVTTLVGDMSQHIISWQYQ